MKSIKPGRGPSGMNAIGSICAAIFGVFWIIVTSSIGAPVILPLFGIIFIIMAIAQAVYHYKNATGKNRFSTFDITEDGEEIDPLQQRFSNCSNSKVQETPYSADDVKFCPYCGASVKKEFEFCAKCGKKLP
ncbi:MAG: zinc-ribbon domain-containing protein [Oscillospiraceae bacterium]